MANRLQLSGRVYKTPLRKVSPSGIPHCQLVLEHHSTQMEAGFNRQVWCRLAVVISGNQHLAITHSITAGMHLNVSGFISTHPGRNGLYKLVLHAEQIELIDSGE